jgi:hypothetical protein
MYTLLGLIQLLMLTQLRLMPDLDMLFKPSPPPTEAVFHLLIAQTKGAETNAVYRQVLITTRRKSNTKKWIPAEPRNNVSRRLPLKTSFGRRVVTANKLYLVFCQWKTEG